MRGTVSALMGMAIVLTSALPLAAQSNPSAADIINSLKPGSTMGSGTRGIRPATGAAPAAEAPVAPAPPTPGATPSAPRPVAASQPRPTPPPSAPALPSANLEVQFASGSADLTPAARATLDQLGKALSSTELNGFRFRIEGHTDTVGSPEQNRALSATRADAVVSYLAQTYHLDRARMQPVGMGSDHLAVPTAQQVAEPRNRRVQVVNIGA